MKAIVKCVSKINDNYRDIQDSYIKTQNEKIQQLEDTLKIKCQAIVDKDRQYRELEKAYQGQREHIRSLTGEITHLKKKQEEYEKLVKFNSELKRILLKYYS